MTFSPALVAEVMSDNRKRLLDTVSKLQSITSTLDLNKAVNTERRAA